MSTKHSTITGAKFLHNNTTLRVNLRWLKCNKLRPVVKNKESQIDVLCCYGQILNLILCIVPRCRSIEVKTELNSRSLQTLNHRLIWEILRAIESHMLKEVSQSLLVILLLHSTHIVVDIETRLTLGLLIVADIVGHTIIQFANANGRVER